MWQLRGSSKGWWVAIRRRGSAAEGMGCSSCGPHERYQSKCVGFAWVWRCTSPHHRSIWSVNAMLQLKPSETNLEFWRMLPPRPAFRQPCEAKAASCPRPFPIPVPLQRIHTTPQSSPTESHPTNCRISIASARHILPTSWTKQKISSKCRASSSRTAANFSHAAASVRRFHFCPHRQTIAGGRTWANVEDMQPINANSCASRKQWAWVSWSWVW